MLRYTITLRLCTFVEKYIFPDNQKPGKSAKIEQKQVYETHRFNFPCVLLQCDMWQYCVREWSNRWFILCDKL